MKTYQGLLSLRSWGDADDILFLSSLGNPLAEELEWMAGKTVSAEGRATDQAGLEITC